MSGNFSNRRVDTIRKIAPVWALLLPLFCLPLTTQATTGGWNVDGEHGELHVTGYLTEAACRLDMVSEFQEVELGNTPTTDLVQPGGEGKPVPFQIRLRDCLRTQSQQRDSRTGNLIWSANQPVVSIAFLAPADADNPALVRVNGVSVSGVGLKLMDDRFRTQRLGNWNTPRFLDPGQDELTYYAAPTRTSAPLAAGSYQATVNFALNYQ